ncbi:P2X purinoceptor 7 [Aix galericulata]|nr:P2X purinoceptor 7 [Aix galericulata]
MVLVCVIGMVVSLWRKARGICVENGALLVEKDSTNQLQLLEISFSKEVSAMVSCGCLKDPFHYDSPKSIRFRSVGCVCAKWFIYVVIAIYVCYTLIAHRRYQEKEEVTSSVRTSSRDSFFVMTNVIQTENQLQSRCPEAPFAKAICSTDKSCEKGSADIHSNGVQTGRCVQYNATLKTCEIKAWCPVSTEEDPPVPAVLRSSEDFTVLIKNNVHFPKFNYTVQNISPNFNSSCTFNKITSPLCPIFRLGDILQEAKENFSEVAVKGGVIAIEIKWDCNLDSWSYYCSPEYGFRRLDGKTRTQYPGFSFRFARHYRLLNGKEQRTLFRAYGIRFDILVFGTGGKFGTVELFTYIGSTITYFGLAFTAIEIFFFLYNCSCCCKIPFCDNIIRKKYETVLEPKQLCLSLLLPMSLLSQILGYSYSCSTQLQGTVVGIQTAKLCYIPSFLVLISSALQVMLVSYVDKPHVILIKKPPKTSLQYAEGSIFENHPVKFSDPCSFFTEEPSENHDTENSQLSWLMQSTRSPECPRWCCCGQCNLTQKSHEQLCCRSTDGPCITTTYWFKKLVLSRETLNKALLYEDPFLDLKGDNTRNQLRHAAYKQYVHWRFGSSELEDRAVIPSCCRGATPAALPG